MEQKVLMLRVHCSSGCNALSAHSAVSVPQGQANIHISACHDHTLKADVFC